MHHSDKEYSGKEGGVQFIQDRVAELELAPQTQTDALGFYRDISEEFTYGSWPERAGACLYLACKHNLEPVAPRDVSYWSSLGLLRVVSEVKDELGVSGTAHIFSGEFILDYSERLELDETAVNVAFEIAEVYFDAPQSSGKTKRVISASAVYLAAWITGDYVTQGDIRSVADISKTAVKRVYEDQIEVYQEEKDNEISEALSQVQDRLKEYIPREYRDDIPDRGEQSMSLTDF